MHTFANLSDSSFYILTHFSFLVPIIYGMLDKLNSFLFMLYSPDI